MSASWVVYTVGVPLASDFMGNKGFGASLCIDKLTGNVYYLAVNDIPTLASAFGPGTAVDITQYPSAVRQVGTATQIANDISTTLKQYQAVTGHRIAAAGGTKGVRIAFGNFYCPITTGQETASGGTTTITASLEYPMGTRTQLLFSGAVSGLIPSGSYVFCDASIDMPEKAFFKVHAYGTNTAGVCYSNNPTVQMNLGMGESIAYAASGLTDKTMSGTPVLSDGGINTIRPIAIIGTSRAPAVAVIGDSRVVGNQDTNTGAALELGIANLLAEVPYLNLSTGGCQTSGWTAGSGTRANRVALAAYCTHVLHGLGINDVGNGVAAATIQNNLTVIAGYLPGKPQWLMTMPPYTTSTDSWATTANQTVTANEAKRTTVNDWMRTIPTGFNGMFDIADALESARNSGKWKVSSVTGPFTSDGLHCNINGRLELFRLKPINLGAFQ